MRTSIQVGDFLSIFVVVVVVVNFDLKKKSEKCISNALYQLQVKYHILKYLLLNLIFKLQ